MDSEMWYNSIEQWKEGRSKGELNIPSYERENSIENLKLVTGKMELCAYYLEIW